MAQFLLPDGSIRGHPGWLIGDTQEASRPLTDDELVAHGYGLKIVDVPYEYDPSTQAVSVDPVEDWVLDEDNGVVYRSFTVTDLTPEEIRGRMPELSPRQLRLGLLSIGITESQVDEALAGDPAGLIEWKYATHYKRTHPLVSALIPMFELTEEQVDTLWMWAADL